MKEKVSVLLWRLLGVLCAAACLFFAAGTIGTLLHEKEPSTFFCVVGVICALFFGIAAVLCFTRNRKVVSNVAYAVPAPMPVQTAIKPTEKQEIEAPVPLMLVSFSFPLDADEALLDAVDIIFETGQASVSMIQRKLKIGFARAARLMDTLEEMGVVGPFAGSRPREILMSRAEFDAVYGEAAKSLKDRQGAQVSPPLPPIQDMFPIRFQHIDPDEGLEQPEWAELPYLDAEAIRFWNKKTTDFKIPSYYSETAFGRNVGEARERLLAGGYLQEGELQKNIERKTMPELKAVLADRELKISGKKAELVQRLLNNVPPDELYALFPVGVYEITEKGQKALDQYHIVQENKDYALGFSYYRLMKAKEAHPDEDEGAILGRLIADDISECYRKGDRVRAEDLLSHAAAFALGYGEPEKALECAVLSYFLWAEASARMHRTDPNETNPYLTAMVEKYAVQCKLTWEQLLLLFEETIRRDNPFGIGTEENISFAISALRKGLAI